MRYEIFRKTFIAKKIVEINDVYLLFPDFDSRRLCEWQEKGYITKIINGFYIFNDVVIDEYFLIRIANTIYSPSYLSFETALSHYGLIPEAVYQITSATTRKTKIFNTLQGSFGYRSISKNLFWGYTIDPENGFIIATPEKAILDYLYLRKQFNENDLSEWRLNIDEYKNILNEETIEKYLRLFNNKTLTKKYAVLKEFINA